MGHPPRGVADCAPGRGGGGHDPGEPGLHPARPPRRGGADGGRHRRRPSPRSAGWWTSSPTRTAAARPRRLRSFRLPAAATRTSRVLRHLTYGVEPRTWAGGAPGGVWLQGQYPEGTTTGRPAPAGQGGPGPAVVAGDRRFVTKPDKMSRRAPERRSLHSGRPTSTPRRRSSASRLRSVPRDEDLQTPHVRLLERDHPSCRALRPCAPRGHAAGVRSCSSPEAGIGKTVLFASSPLRRRCRCCGRCATR